MTKPAFTFIDLFSGIGGFHAALTALGGECVYSVEIDKLASNIYQKNWGMSPLGDITIDANDSKVIVPAHDVLCAGFPCQPFSKSGAQKGMEETRGTLYWNILQIIVKRRPSIVMLENVRNLAGPRHIHEWEVIIKTLREAGYRVSEEPAIFSPHLLPIEYGGRPQVRERVFITATYVGKRNKSILTAPPVVTNSPFEGWNPQAWNLLTDLPLQDDRDVEGCDLSKSELLWIDAWDDFVQLMWERNEGKRLPGFPLWADYWTSKADVSEKTINALPNWKANYVRKNVEFYESNKKVIDRWIEKWGVLTPAFPPSRRKLEWQAQDIPRLWDTVMHFRPSGIRAKAPTYLPALVAITQTSIIGPRKRRLSVREAARLQGLPEWFSFEGESNQAAYKQLGNGVSVGAVWHVFKEHVNRDLEFLTKTAPSIVKAVSKSPKSPDGILNKK